MSNFKHFIQKAVPIALTILGSAATVAAVIFAAKEGPVYEKILAEDPEMKTTKKVATAVKTFGPAIGCAAVSVACGVGAHMMDQHTQASLMGATVAIKEGYRKFRQKNAEVNGMEAGKKVLKEMMKDDIPEDLRDEDGEKIYTFHLTGMCDEHEWEIKATKETILNAIIRINMCLDYEGEMTLNQVLEFFEVEGIGGEGDNVGWSVPMLGDWEGLTWLNFDMVKQGDGSILLYPNESAYEGYISDYYIV